MDLALKKKQRHFDIAVGQAATLQVAKPFVAGYRSGRAIHKWRTGTKGQSRNDAADILMDIHAHGTGANKKIADDIIRALAHKNFQELLKASIAESPRS